MTVTVRQLLDLELIREKATLVAGAEGLDRVVTFVTIMEAPDFHEWVDGGEFILTTWYAFSQKPELQLRAFSQLADKIAAIGIKVERFVDKIPDEIVALAEEKQVPVLAIQRDTKFREVIQAIAGELNNYQANLLIEVDRHYQALVKTALADGSLSSMLGGFGQRTRLNCWCLDHDGKELAQYRPAGSDAYPPGWETLVAKIPQANFEPVACYREGEFHVFPCRARKLSLGYLVVFSPDELSEKVRLMANNLVTFLTLKLLDEAETEQKKLAYLIDDILYHHRLNGEQLQEALAAFGLRKFPFYRVFVVTSNAPTVDAQTRLRNYAGYLRGLIREAIMAVRAEEIVVIAGNTAGDTVTARARPWKKNIYVRDEDLAKGVLVSVGPAVRRISELAHSYRMARQTIKAGRPRDGAGGILYYWDYLVQNLLVQGLDSLEYRTVLDQVVIPLSQERKSSNLMDTLEAVVFADDLQDAAERMEIHINTIRYRLRQIMELTGYDFFSPRGRYILTTACMLRGTENSRK
jgi:purine catabolism regulator